MWQRECPNCNKIIIYASQSGVCNGNKRNSTCVECKNERYKGKGNPFFGKKHSDKSKEKFKLRDNSYKKTDKFKKLIRDGMDKAGIKSGGSFYDFWDKAGLSDEEKLIRLNKLKTKHSKNNSGSGNPMFGRPSPKGSGNGWKGWYKNIFFRSLRELSCMIYFEKNKIKWESAEKIKIEYIDYLGQTRNYHPDFLLKDRIIECKPKRLWKTPLIMAKTKAAVKYVKKIGLVYKLIDLPILPTKELDKLVETNLLKFTERYKKKYEQFKQG